VDSERPETEAEAANKAGRRTRRDPLGEATRIALLETAEAMFAERGVEGVSIRQIGLAIGSSNSNVVGYHFGTKEALVEAILLRNREQIEARRAELLERAKRDGLGADVGVLVDALCRPIFERRNAEGRHTYALFLWHIARSNWWARPTYEMSIAATQEILKHIDRALPQVPRPYRLERMQAVGDIVAGALQRLDASAADDRTKAQMFEHALEMAKAVVAMPFDAGKTKDEAGALQSAPTLSD
jgi:AcrR family transcriptional regulator